ncbi:hypothetical protein FBQ97_14625 [Acidobacteria bacterium ACD]|nr:hypothetical protein [Acidobacteria bacterium ACD]
MRRAAVSLAVLLFPALLPARLAAAPPGPGGEGAGADDLAASLEKGRATLGQYRFRLRSRMKVDGEPRIEKLEEVHLGPDGDLVREKTLRFERRPAPTPVPFTDPRSGVVVPLTEKEEDRLFAEAEALVHLYLTLPASRIGEWAAGAEVMTSDPEREGRRKLHGRGLGRPLDDAVVYLDPATGAAEEVEVKTTATEQVKDIAFLRVTFQVLPPPRPGAGGAVAPKEGFLNMDRGRRRVVVEMETSDFRSWP